MAGYCDNFSMIDGDSSSFSMIDGGDEFKAFPGLKGDDGTTFYPHVSAEGVLSWTNDGGKPNPDPVNIKGADGKSAYAAAVQAGFTGTEAEFNEYLSSIGDLTEEVAQQKSAIEDLQDLTNRKAGMLVDTASGAIASFTPDSTIPDLLGVTVDVEPVQDLHGHDSPWPAGGGVNLLPPFARDDYTGGTVSADGLTVTTGTRTDNNLTRCILSQSIDAVQDATYYISFDARLVSGSCDNFATVSLVGSNGNTLFNWRTAVDNPTLSSTKQRYKFYATGKSNVAATKLYIQGVNTNNAVVEFSNVCISLAASYDYSPYSNICPISGWTGANVSRTGKNVFDGVVENGTIDQNGNNAPQANRWRSKNYIPVKPNTSYTFSLNGAEKIVNWKSYGANKEFLPNVILSGSTFTTSSNVWFIRFFYDETVNVETGLQLELGSTATTYESYRGTTIPISWQSSAGTVYGGTLDVTNGTMTIEWGMYTFNGSEDGWNAYPASQYGLSYFRNINFYQEWAGSVTPFETIVGDYYKSNTGLLHAYQWIDGNSSTPGQYGLAIGYGLRAALNGLTPDDITLAQWKTWLASNPIQLLAKLKNPITITLDPVTIATIANQTNNVWADAGDVDVTYAADIKAYIDRLNQPTEEDMVANNLIASGKYFTVNNKLYLSTASIAAGAQIIPGHNCTETSLVEALNALNA